MKPQSFGIGKVELLTWLYWCFWILLKILFLRGVLFSMAYDKSFSNKRSLTSDGESTPNEKSKQQKSH
jgi:hypothetical protein